jgi:hypothetical protein
MSLAHWGGSFVKSWRSWWASLSFQQRLWPLVLVLTYWLLYGATGILQNENIILGFVLLIGGYGGRVIRNAFLLLLPAFLTAMVYQTQPLYIDLLRGSIRVFEPYWFDWTFFGIWTPEGRVVPTEWWQQHTHPILDVITGFFYLFYFATFLLMALFFYYWKGRGHGAAPENFRLQSLRMMWAFFWCNVLGYSTYIWYPAAPPWYLEKYGLGVPDPNTLPDPAGTIRFDEFFDVTVFSEFYSKSANVFGAIPSLHIAYPLIAVYFAFRLRSLRSLASINYIVVSFSAVYLNHHYVLDLIWGALYALGVAALVEFISKKRHQARLRREAAL